MTLQIHLLDFKEIPLDVLLSNKFLSNIDKRSFEKFTNIDVKKEKIVSTIFKNKYVGDYYLNDRGKPLSESKYFNISHSYGVIAYVEADNQVGIDIEKIRDVDEDLINYISNETEKSYIKNEKNFYEVWTNKEALSKSIGSGIDKKIKDIPGLPLNSVIKYEGKKFVNKTISYLDYIITVSLMGEAQFDLEIIKEVI